MPRPKRNREFENDEEGLQLPEKKHKSKEIEYYLGINPENGEEIWSKHDPNEELDMDNWPLKVMTENVVDEAQDFSNMIMTTSSTLNAARAALIALDDQLKKLPHSLCLQRRRETLIHTVRHFLQFFHHKASSVCTDG